MSISFKNVASDFTQRMFPRVTAPMFAPSIEAALRHAHDYILQGVDLAHWRSYAKHSLDSLLGSGQYTDSQHTEYAKLLADAYGRHPSRRSMATLLGTEVAAALAADEPNWFAKFISRVVGLFGRR